MDLELDPFDDILSEPVVINARARTKFQPKAKLRSKKETPVLVPSSLSDSAKETTVIIASGHEDTSQQSVSPFDDRTHIASKNLALSSVDTSSKIPCGTTLTGPELHLEAQEAANSTGVVHPEFLVSDGDKSSELVDISRQNFTTKETADFFGDLESLDDILSQPNISNVSSARKFQPKVKTNAQPRNKLPISRSVTIDADRSVSQAETPSFHTSNTEGMEADPSLLVVSSVHSTIGTCSSMQTDTTQDFIISKELLNSRETAAPDNGDLWMANARVEREEEAFPGLESFDLSYQATTATGNGHLLPSETDYLDEHLTPGYAPDGFIDFSAVRFSDYECADVHSELHVTKDLTNLDDASATEVVPEEIVDSQTVRVISEKESTESGKENASTTMDDTIGMVYSANVEGISVGAMDERPVTAASEGNETGNSLRQLRKRSVSLVVTDEMEDGASENGDLLYEPCNNSLGHVDDNNDNDNQASDHKRAHKRSKKTVVENEKTVRRHKKSSEGPDSSNKKPPKKKFSHSTRRNRRRVDKVLLETPEEEINPRKLAIKDLILLAEAKERLLSKDATASRNSFPNQSVNNFFTANAPYNQEDPFASTQGQYPDDDQATPIVQESSFKLNYHSYMDKIPRERWSKQDTELFYEAVRQFGTDFAMIQQLFTGRTRHQVKLKYKKEERQQPMKLHDALTNRSKDHSHFDMVIERLRKAAAEADENFNRDAESVDLTGEEEETAPEMDDEEVDKLDEEEVETFQPQEKGAKPEQKKEEVTNDSEPMVSREVHSPVKSHESEVEDVYDRWSEYKSDYDVF